MFTLALTLALLADPDPADGRFVVLPSRSNTLFVLLMDSIRDRGRDRRATLVSIYPVGQEDWEVVRTDSELEFDCARSRFRGVGEVRYDAKDRAKRSVLDGRATAWQPLPEFFPPLVAATAVVCEKADVSDVTRPNFRAAIPELRARVKD